MRPLLLPALRRLWRDETTLQLGVDPARAVVLHDVGPAMVTVLERLDGRHTIAEITALAEAAGVARSTVSDLLGLLARCGAVIDGEPAAGLPKSLPVSARRRLGPDLAALSLSVGVDAGTVLAQRSRRAVVVRATGRIGPVLGALLAASGVGRVHLEGAGIVSGGDVCPGGLMATDEHRSYAMAAAEAVRRAAPEVNTRPMGPNRQPDLVVLADSRRPAPTGAADRAIRSVPHLPVSLRDGTAVIGPLIVPGHTACLGCVELHRLDRDPVWPALAAQLSTARSDRPDPSHLAIAALAAAVGASQVLCHLDGGEPEALGGSLELTGLGDRVRRRSWAPHPRCDCTRSPQQAGH